MKKLDANEVWPNIWVGGDLSDHGGEYLNKFGVVVLCARELQPRLAGYKGTLIRPAFDDTIYPAPPDIARALNAADYVATEVAQRKKALVTCAAGMNRSALVAACAMLKLSNLSGAEVINQIRATRSPHALGNNAFCILIANVAKSMGRH